MLQKEVLFTWVPYHLKTEDFSPALDLKILEHFIKKKEDSILDLSQSYKSSYLINA